jgi:hypothetical protein
MRFAYGLGLLHGHLPANDVLLENDGVIQISDFWGKSLPEVASFGGDS